MLSDFKSWYVFGVCKNLRYQVWFAAFVAVCLVAFSLDNFLKISGLDWSYWIWLGALIIEFGILANIGICYYLHKNLIVHKRSGQGDWWRYFLCLDDETGKALFFKEADYLFWPKFQCSVIHLVAPYVSKEDRQEKIFEKIAGGIEINPPNHDRVIRFDVIMRLSGGHDLRQLVNFVSDQFYNTGIAYAGYEDYLTRIIVATSTSWVEEADRAAYEAYDAENMSDDDISSSDLYYRTIKEYLRIAQEKFKPILLPNVKEVVIQLSGGKKEFTELQETERITVEQNEQN